MKGYEWFEARDYTNPGNLAGCMIHKTRYGVGGCYELICKDHADEETCESHNNTFWCNASTAEPTAGPTLQPTAEPTAGPALRPTPGPTPRPTAEPTPSCYDYCEAWFGAGTPGYQCYNCYGANKCVDVAGSHCYYADDGAATCTAAGHIYC